MTSRFHRVVEVAIPAQCAIRNTYPATDLADAYAVALPAGASIDPERLATFAFEHHPAWIDALMAMRDVLVAGFGLKTSLRIGARPAPEAIPRIGLFRIHSRSPREIVLGEDDRHLDFRLSVLCEESPASRGEHRLVVSTVVQCHNRLGRTYIACIAPFHRQVVRSALGHAARIGWPRAEDPPATTPSGATTP